MTRWSRWRDERGRFVSKRVVSQALTLWSLGVEASGHLDGDPAYAERRVFEVSR